MKRKTLYKKTKKSKHRKTIKRGGIGSAEKKKLAEIDASKERFAGILEKIRNMPGQKPKKIATTLTNIFKNIDKKELINSHLGINKPMMYDLDAVEDTTDQVYDMGMASKSDSNDYMEVRTKTKSPQNAELPKKKTRKVKLVFQQDDLPIDTEIASSKSHKKTTSKEVFKIKPGSWHFYALQILDSDPKNENELSELMRANFSARMTGKTPDNTLNYVLQELVKEGYAGRVEYLKGKRKAYKYFKILDI
jgi:polyhydroxyalkanoate synthesis regulator phasin